MALPQVVIAPLVGFDFRCYRLGYGGGFFDRTLARLNPKPVTIGVGYPDAELRTIFKTCVGLALVRFRSHDRLRKHHKFIEV
jgi:hypothetical protein